MKQTNYSDSGVHVDLGDSASEVLYNAAKITWENRSGRIGQVMVPYDDFRGIRAIDFGGLPEGTVGMMEMDGIGTKVEVAERLKNHRTMAYDLIAMNTEDCVTKGAEPIIFASILDVNTLKSDGRIYLEEIKQLAEGYIAAAKEADVAIVNGELAELGDRVNGYGDFNYNWGGAVFWLARADRILEPDSIQPGDSLVGLKEEGFRSNGLSLTRKILEKEYGSEWHNVKYNGESIGNHVLKPSRIYTRAITEMFGGYDREPKASVHGVAHITGGGIPAKLGGILKPRKLGAYIDNPMEPCRLMLHCKELGNVSDKEAYKTWNMGQGMVVVTPEPENVMSVARSYNISSDIIGTVRDKPGIIIRTRGSPGNFISF